MIIFLEVPQQATATRHLGLNPEETHPTLFHVLQGQATSAQARKPTDYGVDLIPGHPLLAAIEEALEEGKDERLLKEAIKGIRSEYDVVILDTPPGKAMLAKVALVACDKVIIPLQAERPAMDSVNDAIQPVLNIVRDEHGSHCPGSCLETTEAPVVLAPSWSASPLDRNGGAGMEYGRSRD